MVSLDAEALAVLRSGPAQVIARTILAHPSVDVAGLSERAGLGVRCTYRHVRRFVEAGLVTSSTSKGYRHLAPTPRLLAMFRVATEEEKVRATGRI